MRLASVEADSGVAKSVEALLRLATVRLGAVVQAMVAALESLSKVSLYSLGRSVRRLTGL